MKMISVVTPCYNEEGNVRELRDQIKAQFAKLPGYTYEHIYIDNASTDGTRDVLRALAAEDSSVKLIFNTRNFGHIRSPHHAMMQAKGDAVLLMASDLEDPPALIPELIKKWEDGFKVVAAIKKSTQDTFWLGLARTLYYQIVTRISDAELLEHFTGFGLYDRMVMDTMRNIRDPYPYFRGLISELGYKPGLVYFDKPARPRGFTKNNFITNYDMAMLGITKHSVIPIRMATLCGFVMSMMSLLLSFGYFVFKLTNWYKFEFGLAPMLIGMFFLGAVQLFFIGVIGEYIASIHTQVRQIPWVIEEERINF